MNLNFVGLKDREGWAAAHVTLPQFDVQAMRRRTAETPLWVHFGSGNIFRAFIARLHQTLLNKGLSDRGIIAAETFDQEIIDKIYAPHDDLSLVVSMKPDGSTEREIAASVADHIHADFRYPEEIAKLRKIFENPSLQMVSFTITEKGYALKDLKGEYLPVVQGDLKDGPEHARHAVSIVVAMMLARYRAGGAPIALVSMDNCSRNGEKLRSSALTVTEEWRRGGFVDDGFAAYMNDESRVAFPWSMIDKITPRPSPVVEKALAEAGIADMETIVTARKTYIAPFVNTEVPQYLVVEDTFPNGRPPLEQAGVYFTDRETVNKTERMKVMTCLNPLHTALAVYGCLLGYTSIAAEMKDPNLPTLISHIGYDEGMPVVVDPGIIRPTDFIHEVIDRRLPNPFIPDTPQRIATDTSQKIPVRFGETIKAYEKRPDLDPAGLTYIPLALAGWLRYLLGVDDGNKPMAVSSDPMLPQLQKLLSGVTVGKPESCRGKLGPILSNVNLFGTDLCAAGLEKKIEGMLSELLAGQGAVRAVLKKYC